MGGGLSVRRSTIVSTAPFFQRTIRLSLPAAWKASSDANKLDFFMTFFQSPQMMQEDAHVRDVARGGTLLHFSMQRIEGGKSTLQHVTRRDAPEGLAPIESFSMFWEAIDCAAPHGQEGTSIANVGWRVHRTQARAPSQQLRFDDGDAVKAAALLAMLQSWSFKPSSPGSTTIEATLTARIQYSNPDVPPGLLQMELERLRNGLLRMCDRREKALARFAASGGRPAGRWAEDAKKPVSPSLPADASSEVPPLVAILDTKLKNPIPSYSSIVTGPAAG